MQPNSKNNEQPTAPQNFDHVPRYVSHLPVERVDFLYKLAYRQIENLMAEQDKRKLNEDDFNTLRLAGYVMELSEPNK